MLLPLQFFSLNYRFAWRIAEVTGCSLAEALLEDTETQYIALWGQFLDHRGQVKLALAGNFLTRLASATTLYEILHAFPYPVLRLESPIEVFDNFYCGGQP